MLNKHIYIILPKIVFYLLLVHIVKLNRDKAGLKTFIMLVQRSIISYKSLDFHINSYELCLFQKIYSILNYA